MADPNRQPWRNFAKGL